MYSPAPYDPMIGSITSSSRASSCSDTRSPSLDAPFSGCAASVDLSDAALIEQMLAHSRAMPPLPGCEGPPLHCPHGPPPVLPVAGTAVCPRGLAGLRAWSQH